MKVRERVRTPSRAKGGWSGFRRWLGIVATGRNLKGLALLLLGAYLLVSLANWFFAVTSFGDVGVSDTRADVHYALGPPGEGGQDAPVWKYTIEAGASFTVEFDGAGNVKRLTCLSPTAEPNSCPELYGRGIGEDEGTIAAHLGSPDIVAIRGDKKYMTYRGLGATYILQRFIVTGLVRDTQQGSFLGKSWKFIRNLVYLPGGIG